MQGGLAEESNVVTPHLLVLILLFLVSTTIQQKNFERGKEKRELGPIEAEVCHEGNQKYNLRR